jgi:tRNA pseudouridine55 synthase
VLGFLNIKKPKGMTSHDVVAKCRRALGIKKIGHAGTLDPMATGVLVLCLGGATRLSEYVMQSTKRYRAGVRLGITTDTYDAEGQVLSAKDASHLTQADIEVALSGFLGHIQQVPPMYSAIKQGGRKLYDIARAGQVVERQARAVQIDALNIVDWNLPEFTLDVTCSAGTYIRSLAYDLGQVLGVGAHLSSLTRLASGAFTIENAIALEELFLTTNWGDYLIAPPAALPNWPVIRLTAEETDHIQHGRAIQRDQLFQGLAFACAPDGGLLGLVESGDSLLRPHKVFST